MEVQNLLVAFVSKQGSYAAQAEMNILDFYDIDKQTAQELFLLCNEYASRLTAQNAFSKA